MAVANRGQIRPFPRSPSFETRVSSRIPLVVPRDKSRSTVWKTGTDPFVLHRLPFSDPQDAGDGGLIMSIPALHTLNDSYNLL